MVQVKGRIYKKKSCFSLIISNFGFKVNPTIGTADTPRETGRWIGGCIYNKSPVFLSHYFRFFGCETYPQ